MAGFVLPDALIRVDFSQTSLAGFELALTEMSTQELFELSDMAAKFQGVDVNDNIADLDPEVLRNLRALFERFAGYIAEWNLEKPAGNPVPVTAETLLRYPPRFTFTVLNLSLAALNGAAEDSDLGKDSSSGPTSQVASIPMETLSENLQS